MKISPTSKARLSVYFALFAFIGWAITKSWPSLFGQALQISYSNVLVLLVLVSILVGQGLQIRRAVKLPEYTLRMGTSVIARFVLLVMAVSRVGAATGGMYLGIFVYYTTHEFGEISRGSLLPSALSSFLSVMLIAISLWIEHLTKLPPENQATGNDT